MKVANPKNLNELRGIFNSADLVDGYTVFNIGGNSYRLVTAVHYDKQICYIRIIWTHYLKQSDLAEIFGGQANVSKFLSGERALSKSQILGLKNKFKISGDFFLK